MHLVYVFLIAGLAAGGVYYVEDFRGDVSSQLDGVNVRVATEMARMGALQQHELGVLRAEVDSSTERLSGDLDELRLEDARLSTRVRDLDETIDAIPEPVDFATLADETLDSVVKIAASSSKDAWSSQSGSGFFVSRDGYVTTNAHVILVRICDWDGKDDDWSFNCTTEKADKITVTSHSGEKLTARLVDYDQTADIAVLKVDGSHEFLEFGDSSDLRVGDQVVAFGNPLGLDFTTTIGSVSAVRNDLLGMKGVEFIQFDASISFGSSGGPLLNTDGEVVGITTLGTIFFGDFNFAVSSDHAEPIIEKMIRND